ncbi:BppU family phage baseplate upper protein [Jeotgalibaca arthritidis]|uniref:BppU family phage baseplate upper protein n=1 Tax=Jeotgalibaca arthritidis TaxID=1868794 RepID=UPI0035A0383D
MAIRHSITLSTSEPNNEVGNLKIRQGDEQTQTLVANITENGVPKPFVGLQPFFCAKLGQTAGLGIIEQKVTGTMNPANGTLEYVMQPEDWQQLGRQTAYFSFRKMVNDHEWTEQFSTRDFNYNVIKSAFSEGVKETKKDGSTYIWTIEDMLRLFKEYIATGKIEWEEFVEQNREVLESVDPGGKLIGELIDARRPFGGEAYATLGERLDSEKAEVSTKLTDIAINVRDFGAKGDGVTDDTIALQNAINKSVGLGKVYLPKGIYMFSSLDIPSNVTVEGNSKYNTTLKIVEGGQGIRIIGTKENIVSYVKLKDVKIVGSSNNVSGIKISCASHILLERVIARENDYGCILAFAWLITVTNSEFRNNRLDGFIADKSFGTGSLTNDQNAVTIENNCSFNSNGRRGITWIGGRSNKIHNGNFEGNGSEAIYLASVYVFSIKDSYFEQNGVANIKPTITLDIVDNRNSYSVLIDNNFLQGSNLQSPSATYGIQVLHSGVAGRTDVMIQNNGFSNNFLGSIFLASGTSAFITNNYKSGTDASLIVGSGKAVTLDYVFTDTPRINLKGGTLTLDGLEVPKLSDNLVTPNEASRNRIYALRSTENTADDKLYFSAKDTAGTYIFYEIPKSIDKYTNYDPQSIAANGNLTYNVTVSGAKLGDYVVCAFSLPIAGIIISGFVSATDTVTVVFYNITQNQIDLGLGQIKIKVIK